MKSHIFGIGVVLMLSFSLAGMTFTAAGVLRRFELKFGPLLSFAVGTSTLVALVAVLAWSVPPRG
ncbi:hypothetical protein R69746_06182 [Paraburkholderia aspalathi]|uniref:hypothetical protein n=1 Tax=Paraburkholderia aspalathi TaxID=1324617 RepID=UPI00190B1073|nr:hypothetical protein [Paraburkholderia aspalathi]MBK3844355.1 hypothetical protein [Paraburkholderia aspalathi]CAE6823888.1 hypothetical protein R69746_06182 [Paraburkholderia aspalathi]